MKKSYLTVTDQFCGAGGSSAGVRSASQKMGGGLEVHLAMNHNKLAVETHNTNFPEAIHDCADISASNPRRYPSTDGLVTSPECTNQTPANGKKKAKCGTGNLFDNALDEKAERSRATMWDVPRFAEVHHYNFIIVENVVEARKWVMWDSWLMAMHSLGYKHKCKYLNSMHFFPTPQSRDRMFIVFWKSGNKEPDLNYTPLAYSPSVGKDVNAYQSWKNPKKQFGKYKTQYFYRCPFTNDIVEPYYYAAFNCIDWSDIGTQLINRKTPLCEKSMARIKWTIDKYWDNESDSTFPAYILNMNKSGKGHPSHQVPFRTFTAGGINHSLLINHKGKSTGKSIFDPSFSFTTQINQAIVTPEGFKSYLTYYNGKKQASLITEPAGTFPTKQRVALISGNDQIDQSYYRMLKYTEIQKGMAFDDDYIVLGTIEDKVRQLGNAVTPPVMEWLVTQCVNSLN